MRRPLALAALLLTIAAATGCGAKEEPTDATHERSARRGQRQ